uniref:Uncharacterized protein n=1 Tax=Vespula pensylvanica TaxID=30213 RepID=A0A834MXY1_VESPE|nr:hypothetical protein H0235_017884 [Vespula pensylvanica]
MIERGGRRRTIRRRRGGGGEEAEDDEKGKRDVRRGKREGLDAGFFQRRQGYGRMDVGIMEASTVPSSSDKKCGW